MLIICDQCELPISGTVTKVPGNFNLHPECLNQFQLEPSLPIGLLPRAAVESATLSLRQPSMMALARWQPNTSSLELVRA